MRNRFARFMSGRYGADNLTKFLSLLAFLFLILSLFTKTYLSTVFWIIALGLLVYGYIRMFSRNIYVRRAENEKYLRLKGKLTAFFRAKKDRLKQSRTYRFFPCPSCKATMRVPKGKGRIVITCSRCGTSFERRS